MTPLFAVRAVADLGQQQWKQNVKQQHSFANRSEENYDCLKGLCDYSDLEWLRFLPPCSSTLEAQEKS